jgi:putative transposase
MPDHIHVLLSLGSSISIERALQLIKGGSSFRASHELGLRSQLWERGFSEVRILNASDFDLRARYIRQNPVRARLVAKADEYRYSSAFEGYELDPSPFAGAKARTQVTGFSGTTKVVP